MVDFLEAIRKAANKGTEAASGGDTTSSTGKKFDTAVKNAEQTAASNNQPTQPRTLVADRITEQKQANRFIGNGGDINIRPLAASLEGVSASGTLGRSAGISASTSLDPNDPQSQTPEEAAASVTEANRSNSDIELQEQSELFVGFLDENSDNAEWIDEFYEALGPEQTASLINRATSKDLNSSAAEGNGRTIGNSLIALQQDGRLNQTDVDQLVGEIVASDSRFEDGIGFNMSGLRHLFPDNVSYSSDRAERETRQMFAESLINISIGEVDLPDGSTASENNRLVLAANATEILATLPNQDVVRVLYGLGERDEQGNYDWSNLTEFFGNAAQGQRYHGFHQDNLVGNLTPVLDALGTTILPSMSPSTASEMRSAAFIGTIEGINEADGSEVGYDFAVDADFKNELATIFNNEHDQVIEDLQVNSNLDTDAINVLTKFFEIGLFTPSLGDSRHRDLNALPDTVSQFLTDFVTDANGNQSVHSARLAGEILGAIYNGSENRSADIADKQEARDRFIDLTIGFTFDLIPFPGTAKLGKVGAEAVEKALKAFDGVLRETTIDRLEDMTAAEAKAFLAEELKGQDDLVAEGRQAYFKDLFNGLTEALGEGLDGDSATKLQSQFEDGVDFVDGANGENTPLVDVP